MDACFDVDLHILLSLLLIHNAMGKINSKPIYNSCLSVAMKGLWRISPGRITDLQRSKIHTQSGIQMTDTTVHEHKCNQRNEI